MRRSRHRTKCSHATATATGATRTFRTPRPRALARSVARRDAFAPARMTRPHWGLQWQSDRSRVPDPAPNALKCAQIVGKARIGCVVDAPIRGTQLADAVHPSAAVRGQRDNKPTTGPGSQTSAAGLRGRAVWER